jgi:hypothetical protein
MAVSITLEGIAPGDYQAEARRQSLLAAKLDLPVAGWESMVADDLNDSYGRIAQDNAGFDPPTRR